MLSDEEPIGAEFVWKWRIEKFNMCPLQGQEYFKSPDITLKSFCNTTWYLKVHPRVIKRSNDNKYIDYICCYLVRAKNDHGPESIDINFKLSMNSVEKLGGSVSFVNGNGSGGKFIARESSLISPEQIDIECYMNMSDFAEKDEKLNDLTETKLLPSTQETQEVSILSNRCFIHSKVSSENRSFICPIKDIDRSLPTLSFMEDRNLITTLHLEDYQNDEVFLEADISFKEELTENLFAVCSMQILDSCGEICNITEDEYLFTKQDETEVWQFTRPFPWNVVNEAKNAHLCFEFSVSNGNILSNLEWFVNVSYHPKFSSRYLTKGFLKEMFRSYKEKKYCDVVLCTKDKVFECHKTVLCAQSTVFAAIFESGMKEYAINTIPIENLDSEIVSEMIDFMYTLKIKDMGLKKAMKLFSAAELYQIDSLKRKCCDFLKLSLNRENFSEILSLSHTVSDDRLKQLVIGFITRHKNEILFSCKWKELAAANINLAYEVLMQIALDCNKNKESECNSSD